MCTPSTPCTNPNCNDAWALLLKLIRIVLRKGTPLRRDIIDYLAQVVALQLLEWRRRKGKEWEPPSKLGGLAVKIAFRTKRRWLKRASRDKPWQEEYVELLVDDEDDGFALALEDALRSLPGDAREIFVSSFFRRISQRRCAKEHGVSLHHVRKVCDDTVRYLGRFWGH